MRTDIGPIPHNWTRLWYAKYSDGRGDVREYVVGRVYNRGANYHERTRRWKCKALYQTGKGYIVAVAAFPDSRNSRGRPSTTVLSLHRGSLDGWTIETDADRNTREECRCSFCGTKVMVRPWNRRARDKCPCGARHFMRLVRDYQGNTIHEEEGWRKNGREWIRC